MDNDYPILGDPGAVKEGTFLIGGWGVGRGFGGEGH